MDKLNQSDNLVISREEPLNMVERRERLDIQKNFWDKLHLKEILLKQKARQRRIQKGDQNTKYFQVIMKEKLRSNFILYVQTYEGRVEGVDEVKEAVKCHYEARFKYP